MIPDSVYVFINDGMLEVFRTLHDFKIEYPSFKFVDTFPEGRGEVFSVSDGETIIGHIERTVVIGL